MANWTQDEINQAKGYFATAPSPNAIYEKAAELKLSGDQVADLYARAASANPTNLKYDVNEWLAKENKALPGGYTSTAANTLPSGKPTLEDLAYIYQTELGRAPDIGGLQYWSGRTGSYEDILKEFRAAAANEIAARPNVTPEAIKQLYQTELGRAPDVAGAEYWTGRMGAKIDPNEVAAFRAAAQKEIQSRLAAANRPGVSQSQYDALMNQVAELQNQIKAMSTRTTPLTPGSGMLPGGTAVPGVNMSYTQPVTGLGAELAPPAYNVPVNLPVWGQRPILNVGGTSVLGALPVGAPPDMLTDYRRFLAAQRGAVLQADPLAEELKRAYNPAASGPLAMGGGG